MTVNAAGVYTFTPNQAARDAAAQTEGPDFTSFSVVASDGQLATAVTSATSKSHLHHGSPRSRSP